MAWKERCGRGREGVSMGGRSKRRNETRGEKA